ncbi:MAG: UDP-N-acetylmuramate dehydrogenase [candidate division WOR-3 bacterium]|nr:UDP-N-acetylmuramate dehydrogenase [candidate division WOR-3 bacterium]MDH7518330.1 UDP-N-acetylmuramate dehydrogenase [bacterium]
MREWQAKLVRVFEGSDAVLKFDEPLARWTSFRIGGPADVFVVVNDERQLATLRRWTNEHKVKMSILGLGSNVVVSDQGLRGVVVKLKGGFERIAVIGREKDGGVLISAGAGALLDRVAEFAEEQGLTGAGFLAGIPGTVGGGLLSNAGAFGHCLGEIVIKVRVMDNSGTFRVLEKAELHNEYRSPIIERSFVAVDAVLRLLPGREKQSVRMIRESRWQKHPKEPSAGSFFKNPAVDAPAGVLIERCRLKGVRVGGAQVSEKHANFIINVGGARFADVYELAQMIKAVVEEETEIKLKEEVQWLPRFEGQEGGEIDE